MKSAVLCNFRPYIISLAIALLIIATALPAHAYYYTGGDWGGRDLSLLNGDSLSGDFSNVGQFYIPTGAVISGGEGNLFVNAGSVLLDGNLIGLPAPGYDLKLSSQTDLILNGSLSSWKSIWLSANQISISAASTISVLDGTAAVSPIGSPTVIKGGTLSVVPTPIPATAWLLGSGLLGLAGIRRRMKQA
jgi:hypothetical protein